MRHHLIASEFHTNIIEKKKNQVSLGHVQIYVELTTYSIML